MCMLVCVCGCTCGCVGEWEWVWIGGESGVCYSTPLNCAVFGTEDVEVFSPHSEH